MKFDRNTIEYALAEKIVHLQDALELANKILNDKKLLGVLPSRSVSFRESNKHHKKVRYVLKNNKFFI